MRHRRRIVVSAMATLLIAACASSADSPSSERGSAETAASEAEQGSEAAAQGPVQDLWLYERVASVDTDGEVVELTGLIDDMADETAPDASVELAEGLNFHRYDSFTPVVLGKEDEPRDDVEAVAGFLAGSESKALAVLATPDRDAEQPIGFADRVEIDLTFLEGSLAPGDPLLVDFGFVQTIPTGGGDEVELTGLDLLNHRVTGGSVRYLGDPDSGSSFLYTNEVGLAASGSIKGQLPTKSQPMMDGFEEGVENCEFGVRANAKCVAEYLRDFGAGAAESLKLIDCNLGNSASCDMPTTTTSTTTTTQPAPTTTQPDSGSNTNTGTPKKSARTSGDPHISTFDGLSYDMHAVGEFVVSRRDDLEVQMRTDSMGSDTFSRVAAVAIGIDDHRVMIDSDRVLLDGDAVSQARLDAGVALGSAELAARGDGVEVVSEDGHVVWVSYAGRSWLDLTLEVPLDSSGWEGLLGDGDDDPDNDMRTSDGTVLAAPLDHSDMYDVYAESWRVSDDSTLFFYGDGETTGTFTDRSFPEKPLRLEDLPAGERHRGEALCQAAGIVGQQSLDDCVFDFVLTGEVGAIRTARTTDVYNGVASGRLDGGMLNRFDVARADRDVRAEEDRGWQATAVHLRKGDEPRSTYRCPPDGTSYTVWGTDLYTDDSSVCTAAVHSGLISPEDGGQVVIEHRPGADSYESTERNGVSTHPWDSWGGSFVFVK